jgi:BCD family chlorophyll transporter-like MFS transporter
MAEVAAARRMNWRAVVQVSLLNISVGLILVPLNSTLNRVMIHELGLAATLVGVLIALRHVTAPLRVAFGRLSDRRPIAGRHRTWYIAMGMGVMAVGLVTSPYAALSIPRLGTLGILASVVAFGLIGMGVNLTTPLYFALVADQSSDEQRPRIAATMFIALGLCMAISAFVIGAAVEPYTEQKLIIVMAAVAAVGVVLTTLGLLRIEPRTDADSSCATDTACEEQPRVVRDLLVRNPAAQRFFVYLVLSFVAVETQQVILEPYAARFFGMTPGQTTQLDGFYRIAEIIMLGVGAVLVRRIGHKPTASLGIGAAIVALLLVIGSVPLQIAPLLMVGVFALGLGAGMLETTNLAYMMSMTDAENAGMFMGAWGVAQAIGVGGATILGGALRDLGLLISNSQLVGYVTAYGFEIIVLLAAIPILWRISLRSFRSATEAAPAT